MSDRGVGDALRVGIEGQGPDGVEAGAGRLRRRLKANGCRDYLRERTEDAWETIVRSLVDKAKAGSVPHITLLAKLAGFEQRPAPPSVPERRGKSFARQLREQMEELHARNIAEFGE